MSDPRTICADRSSHRSWRPRTVRGRGEIYRGANGIPTTLGGQAIEATATHDAHRHVVTCGMWRSDDVSIVAFTSQCGADTWGPSVVGTGFGVALPRFGAFQRRTDGQEHIVDRTTGYFRHAGEVSEVAHFEDRAHGGTVIDVDVERGGSALAEIKQARGPFVVGPDLAAAHQFLLAGLRRSIDDLEVQERTYELLGVCLTRAHPGFRSSSRRESNNARRRLIADVCAHLHAPDHGGLVDIAARVHYSPFHLTRVFRSMTGITMSQYRTNLRLHEVLTRLADGGSNLSEIAVAAGFNDHSHMTRTFVAHLGTTPSDLRLLLRAGAPTARAATAARRRWGERLLPSEGGVSPFYMTWR